MGIKRSTLAQWTAEQSQWVGRTVPVGRASTVNFAGSPGTVRPTCQPRARAVIDLISEFGDWSFIRGWSLAFGISPRGGAA